MAEESSVTLTSSESSDASIMETSNNDDTSKYSEDVDSSKSKTTEIVDSDTSDKTVEEESETEAEVETETKSNDELIENQNASIGSGLDNGETPLVDPAHEEDDEIDTEEYQGENTSAASNTSTAILGEIVEEGDALQGEMVNDDNANIDDTYASPTIIEVDIDSDVQVEGKVEAEAVIEVKAEAEVETNTEVEGETEAEIQIDVETSEILDAIEHLNAPSDSGLDLGMMPLIDPEHEEKFADEEDEADIDQDQGENITTAGITSAVIVGEILEEVDALQEEAVNGDELSGNDADSLLTNGEELLAEEEKELDKSNVKDHSHAKDYTHDDIEQEKLQSNLRSSKEENAKDQQLPLSPSSTSTETMGILSPCQPTLRNVKGLECTIQTNVSSHPAGSLAAFLTIFFFCYCACRKQGGIRSKNWRKRMRNFRMKKRGNEGQGEYAALAVYDELLDSFDDEELSSLYRSRDNDDDDGSDSSMSTILSEWSGKKHDIEMSCLEDDLDDYIKDE